MHKIVFEKNGSAYSVEVTSTGIFTSINGGVPAYTSIENVPRHGWVYYIPKDAIKQFFDEIGIAQQDIIIIHPSAEEALELKRQLLRQKQEQRTDAGEVEKRCQTGLQ